MFNIRNVVVLLVILPCSSVRAQIDPVTAASAAKAVWGFATDMERNRETDRFRSDIKGKLDEIFNKIDKEFLNITESEFAVARSEFAIYLGDRQASDAAAKLQQ